MRHLLVIGAQRCGTTYVHSVLDAHPEIAMARPARPEPKVFLDPDVAERGLEWYHARYFPHVESETVLGEKSTSYIEHPQAATTASRVLGDANIVVLLRDPVERALSNWRFSTGNGFEDRSLRQALCENLAAPRSWESCATSVSPYAYVERGRYADYLGPWYEIFGDKVHVWFLEELAGRSSAVAEMYETLGVDPAFTPPALHRRLNETVGAAPTLSDQLLTRLREYFASSDETLRRRLQRPLPWDRKNLLGPDLRVERVSRWRR